MKTRHAHRPHRTRHGNLEQPFGGPFDLAAAAHLFRRAGFGAGRRDLERAVERGLEATLAQLFSTEEPADPMGSGLERLLALESVEPIQAHWMARLLENQAPLSERVTLMWHNHFATSFDKVKDARLMVQQIELLREFGLGDFRVLLHEVARDPAMLLWLDGDQNRRGQANENFAREVMELFALGIGNYTEEDITEAARALTGWGVDRRRFIDRQQYHDPGTKRIFGRSGTFGGRDVIDLVLSQPACPQHIARRLLDEFVTPGQPHDAVEFWAQVLLEEDWDIGRTLRRLLGSERFFAPRFRRSRIAGPVEFTVGVSLALGAYPAPAELARAATDMGQALLRPPSVKGWDGGRTWIHAGSWLARHRFAFRLVRGELKGTGPDWAATLGTAEGNALVASALGMFFPEGVEPRFRDTLAAAAAEASDTEHARLRVITLILTAPEAHLV